MSSSIPGPWGRTDVPARPEPLLAALWLYRHTILKRWPYLPLPTYAPASTRMRRIPNKPGITPGKALVGSGEPAGPGPNIHAAALITVWEEWAYAKGPCLACGHDMLATFWGGILAVGNLNGICTACFTHGSRFLPGVRTAVTQIKYVLNGLPYRLPWTPLAFRLGGPAPSLRAVLAELGEENLGGNELVPYDESH